MMVFQGVRTNDAQKRIALIANAADA